MVAGIVHLGFITEEEKEIYCIEQNEVDVCNRTLR
jgi:hypothetical protein